jgi:hypothetical protein
MAQIYRFPVSRESRERLVIEGNRRKRRREIEAALQQDDHILVAWTLNRYGSGDVISAWHLPKDGKRWVYKHEYDAKNLKPLNTFSRFSCREVYEWLIEGHGEGMHKESHVCAPLYLLLDNKALRMEYISGRLDEGRVAGTQVGKTS